MTRHHSQVDGSILEKPAVPNCFYPEHGGNRFFWNINTQWPNYIASHPRSWNLKTIQSTVVTSRTMCCSTRVTQTKTFNTFFLVIYWTRKVHNDFIFPCSLHFAAISFTATRRFSFAMASTAAMACGVNTRCAWPVQGQSVTEVMPFINFLVHLYTCGSDRHASPYWTFIHRWSLMCFTPSVLKKRMTECCSSLVHVANGAAIFTLLLRCPVALLHRTAICRPLFKLWVSLLSTYKTIELFSNFYRTFKVFIWLSLVFKNHAFCPPSASVCSDSQNIQ